MPTMDKGRPPENKRSRKPAHPVKREISQEMKNFAENTMNELLGWYGYDKVDLHDSEASDIRTHAGRVRRHHVSVLKENSDPKPCGGESKVSMGSSAPNGGREVTCCPLSPSSSSSSPHTKDLHSTRPVVPIIKPSVVEEQQNVRIVCVWCQQEGLKRYCLVMGSELKSFCSEKCFAMCRRAYFKRNKAREEDRHGDKSPPSPGRTAESPSQLLPKITSSTPVCDWCKHVRHTKYLDFGAGEERLQFCSTKCLNQYKMDIFYREARAALTASSPRPTEQESNPALAAGDGHALLTPESWDSPSLEEAGRAAAAPAPTTASSAAPSVSSSARASVSAQRERESSVSSLLQSTGLPGQPAPPPRSTLVQPGPPPRPALVQPAHPSRPALVQPAPPPRRSPVQLTPMPRPGPGQPAPLPRSGSEQPRIIPNFLRPPFHVQGVHSPAHHPSREPDSSPAQRPTHTSPHIHTPSAHPLHPQHILQPYPGPILPCPPAYPHPVPPLVPSLGLPCAQPTLLLPYPIIVPLPVPVPIPIPIPMNSGVMSQTRVIRNHEEDGERDWYGASDIPTDVAGEKSEDGDVTDHILAGRSVKTEQPLSPLDACSSVFSSHRPSAYPELYGATSLSAAQAQGPRDEGTERQVIQRVLRRLPVKQESEGEVGVDLAGHREAEGASSRSRLELNNRATAQLPARFNTDTLPGVSEDSPLAHTPPQTHSLTATPSTHTSLVLWTALNHCSSDTASVVTPTVSILSNNTVASPSATPSFYSLPTASSSDRLHPSSEYRTHASQTLATPPDSEDVKENLSGGRELIFKCPGEQTDCQTDQSEESIGRAAEGDGLTADEEHTYARFIPPKLREKNTHAITHKAAAHTLSQLITHTWDKTSQTLPPAVEESSMAMDMEPALKRRCLSIRDQNK